MKTFPLKTQWGRTSALARGLTLATLAAGAWALSAGLTQAHANDVYWSVGISQPGVSVGVSNAPPVVYQYPVIQHRTVVVHQPYHYVRPVVVVPQPVYYQGQGPRWDERRDRRHNKWQRHHNRHDRYGQDDRYGHGDRYDRDDRHGRGDDDRQGGGRR